MRRIRQALSRHWGYKLLALGGAFALWTYVSARPETEMAVQASIRYIHLPAGLEMDPDQADRLTVIVRGARLLLQEIDRRRVTAEVDLLGARAGQERTFTVTGASLGLPPGVALVRAVPSQLRFTLDRRERREIPVEAAFGGEIAEGYLLESYTVVPPRLMVLGAAKRLAALSHVTTDRIDLSQLDLSQLKGAVGVKTTAYLTDPYLRFATDAAVRVDVRVSKTQ